MVGQALTGERSSTPKYVDVRAVDSSSRLMKKMGNGHFALFMWADTITMSGTEYTIASGVSHHGKAMATYANVVATPKNSAVSANFYIDCDTTNNIVKLKADSSVTADFNIQIVMA